MDAKCPHCGADVTIAALGDTYAAFERSKDGATHDIWYSNSRATPCIAKLPEGASELDAPSYRIHRCQRIEHSTVTPDELRAILTEHNLTQQALANLIGVTSMTVSNWLAGKHPLAGPAAICVRLIAKGLLTTK